MSLVLPAPLRPVRGEDEVGGDRETGRLRIEDGLGGWPGLRLVAEAAATAAPN